MKGKYDAIVIGGGIYGCLVAQYLKTKLKRVAVVEKEDDLLKRASYVNQARIHNGYHYPRSYTTAIRSRINSTKFIKQFDSAIYKDFRKIYAISAINSKVHANQFIKFCKLINAPIKRVPENISSFFNPDLVEDVFEVKEYALDAIELKNILHKQLLKSNIDIFLKTEVSKINKLKNNILSITTTAHKSFESKYLFNCTYSQINSLLKKSNLPLLDFKFEIAEIALIKAPEELSKLGITIMDGPFFSTMPFPAEGLHSLSHVRYTPQYFWLENEKERNGLIKKSKLKSNYKFMISDAKRYVPIMEKSIYVKSLYDIKTVLPINEVDDGRPILFKKDYGGLDNFYIIMGGKIDNIYDILQALSKINFKG